MPAVQLRRAAGVGPAFAAAAILCSQSVGAREASDSGTPFANTMPVSRGETPEPRPMGIAINGRMLADQALIVVAGRRFFIRLSDFVRTGLNSPVAAPAFVLAGQEYVDLSSMPGLAASIGPEGSVLEISASPALFPASKIERSARPVKLDQIVPAAFISYDLTFTRWNNRNAAFAFLDAGVSGEWGLLGTTAALQTMGRGTVRLDSFFQRDWPEDRIRLVIGDTVTRATEWSAPARFAGIRVGTDFSLQPSLVTFPVPTLTEAATLPSTIDLISAAGRQTLSVQPGAFAIDYQPVFSGAGDVTVTITDINGLSRKVTRSFYTSPRLLRPGNVDFSAEAGVLREDYGFSSFDYGAPFAAGFLRFGLTDKLTLGGRIEVSPDASMGGLGIGWVLSPIGEFGLAAAMSDSRWGRGTEWRAQFQRIAPTHSITVSYRQESGHFAQVGDVEFTGPLPRVPEREFAMAGSLSLGQAGDIIIGHAQTRTASGESFRTTNLSFAGDLRNAYYNLGVRRNSFGARTDNGAFLAITMPLGARRSASLRVDGDRTIATYSAAPPNDVGAGFQVAVGYDALSNQPIVDVSTTIRKSAGEIELAGGRSGAGHGIRVSARGALTAVGGQVVATPIIDNAFALVELDSEEDVTLYLENRPVVAKGGVGKTTLLTGLRSYDDNRIAIDISALPITADVDTGEKLVVPGYRQAVRVSFGGGTRSPVTVKLIGPDGASIAAGLEVRIGSDVLGITGYDGLAFLPDLKGGELLIVGTPSARCEAQIPRSLPIGENRQIGPVTCLSPTRLEQNP